MQNIPPENILRKKNGERGWIMGDFKDNLLPYPFFSSKFEIKWANLKKGDSSPVKSDKDRQTLTILVKGKHRVDLPESQKRFELVEEGDYVFFEPGVLHSWEAIEDNLTITIRWSAEHPPQCQ
jgi:hypothetical protein